MNKLSKYRCITVLFKMFRNLNWKFLRFGNVFIDASTEDFITGANLSPHYYRKKIHLPLAERSLVFVDPSSTVALRLTICSVYVAAT